jgi:two-component system response regulator (stage 0 sporulation protein F)
MKTLLLVDDDREMLQMISELLSHMGFQVITRPDAKAALSLLREGARVDLIITDYLMPDIDGLEFLILLKRLLPEVPVIMLTGHGEVESYLKSVSLGVFEYVNKPVKMKELRRIVHAALASAEENHPVCRDETVADKARSGPISRTTREHARCRFLSGKYMQSCGRNKEVHVPGARERQDYCENSMHALCPRYLLDEPHQLTDGAAHDHRVPARNTDGQRT